MKRLQILGLTFFLSAATAPPQFFYGGQAIIEGVLMRGRRHFAVAARRADGSIVVRREPLQSRVYTSKVWAKPFLRGIAGLYEMLALGMRALQWSAGVQLGEEAELPPGAMRAAIGLSILFALGLFIAAPALLAVAFHKAASHSIGGVLFEGLIRAVVLLGYLVLIGRIRSVHRVFEYHGAEHKAINCLEAGDTVDVERVAASSRLHPRCGTGFLVVVALVSAIVFAPLAIFPVWERLLMQVALVPVVAAIAYEGIRGLVRVRGTTVGRLALVPILATQRLSTREPNPAQMEVSIAALQAARDDSAIVV